MEGLALPAARSFAPPAPASLCYVKSDSDARGIKPAFAHGRCSTLAGDHDMR